jgi:acyl-CoA synthetase (AMP-forming)/AMP-acid ligase II
VLAQSECRALVTMTRFGDLDHLGMLDEIAPGWERGATDGLPELRSTVLLSTDGRTRDGALTVYGLEELGARRHPDRASYDLSSLFALVSGAAPAPMWLWERARSDLGVTEITTGYGMTEAGGAMTLTLPEDPAERLISTVGRVKLAGPAGELVAPKEIEELLSGHPGVSQVYVVGAPDERWGEVGCAFVVRDPASDVKAGALIALCRARLARFKVPRHVFFVDAADLPLTPTGKVQKFHLARRAGDLLGGAVPDS